MTKDTSRLVHLAHIAKVGRRQTLAPVTALAVDRGQAELARWPYAIPVVFQVMDEGLALGPRVAILTDRNGPGKSTVVRDGLITTVSELPLSLRRSLTWDQGAESGSTTPAAVTLRAAKTLQSA
jgi:hypothetical protein